MSRRRFRMTNDQREIEAQIAAVTWVAMMMDRIEKTRDNAIAARLLEFLGAEEGWCDDE